MTDITPALPTAKRSRRGVSPLHARIMLAGTPKVGKSTLAAGWAPDTTLIIDTHNGTKLLAGEHFIAHVDSWTRFEQVVAELIKTDHSFETVVIDLADDIWNFCDVYHAGKGAVLASATDDWQRSIKTAEGTFRKVVNALLAQPIGVWFITHAKPTEEQGVTRYIPKLEPRVATFVQGACDFVFLAEKLGTKRLLHTESSLKFEAGSRVPLPDPMELNARKLYEAMDAGLNPSAEPGNTIFDPNEE